ncbi:hypothetical protein [Undibacterium umbellatum]|uniref:Uncharacterized protein n=1 Tax=Undibacterium umbellatum TaxID=2762300 RepID=A0ABR6Z3Y8_9BURK|nr:hypothetical protein [Undibacterium umbellatum]MBC3906249.1 hypothetical protein [Undibacterium umbellatum]
MRREIAERYKQVAQVLTDKWLYIEDIMYELRTSENYSRKLIADLVFSGHVLQRPIPNGRGRNRMQFSWNAGKPAPTVYTRQFTPAQVDIRRTDPLMIALYGNGTSNRKQNNEISGG